MDAFGDDLADQLDGANRVIVAGHDIVDGVGVTVRIHDGHDRDIQAVGFGYGDGFAVDVDDEERAGHLIHRGDTTEVATELRDFAIQLGQFLLALGLALIVSQHGLDLSHALDAAANRDRIGQGAT